MISNTEAQELHQLLAGLMQTFEDAQMVGIEDAMPALQRARDLAVAVVEDTESHPADEISYAPVIKGTIQIGDDTSEFMLPLLNDSVQYSQWGADNYVLGPRVDLLETLANAAQEWAEEHLCRTCKENLLDDNEGYDGECGNCADKTESERGTIYAYLDTVPEPIPADRWMWQTGDNWMAVAPFESEAEWFMDLDERGVTTPTPRVRPIDDIPTSGTLTYMRADFTEVERPANGEKEES